MSDQDDIRQAAADHIHALGSGAVDWLNEQADIADGLEDYAAAQTWRDIAEAAERMLRS
jgi:hypothetical protein